MRWVLLQCSEGNHGNKGKGDYLLNAKGNQGALKKEIEGYIQDEELRKGMDMCSQTEKNRNRIETRVAYSSAETGWMCEKLN